MTVYRVNGPLRYRDHEPGEKFEANLDPDIEERAVRYGTITVIDPRPSGIRPGSFRLPHGWRQHDHHGASGDGGSSLRGATRG